MLDLESIELIHQLKARYFRFLDTLDYSGLQSVFTADAVAHFVGGGYEFKLTGWAELEAFYRKNITPNRFGSHNGHHPEICVDGDQATGIWYLSDTFYNLDHNEMTCGTSLYHDRYVRTAEGWRIAETGYERVYETVSPIASDLKMTVRPQAKN